MATTPQTMTWDEPSSLLSTGHTPLIVTGWMVWLLRTQFGDVLNIDNEQLRNLVWNKDVAQTEILIEWALHATPEQVERRPALLVKENETKPRNDTIGEGRIHGLLQDQSEKATHAVAVTGSHTIFAISTAPAEAVLLATEARRYIQQFGPKIREDLNLLRLLWQGTSPVRKIEEYDEHWGVAVTFSYGYWEAWELRSESPLLKTLSIDAIP